MGVWDERWWVRVAVTLSEPWKPIPAMRFRSFNKQFDTKLINEYISFINNIFLVNKEIDPEAKG